MNVRGSFLSAMLLFFSPSIFASLITKCGTYEINAFIECEKQVCNAIVAKGSLSEEKIQITSNQFYYSDLNKLNADLKVEIQSLKPLKAKTILPPQLALAKEAGFIKLLAPGACK